MLLLLAFIVFFVSVIFGVISYYLIENKIHNITKQYTRAKIKAAM
jgi:peptidoglycan/LPS O-acetylase OafA/YrhL